ncbi:MAG: hypothetical protein AAF617_12165 [Bacteroidota bacterium]
MQTIFSETFAEKFRICDKIANEITIYSKPKEFRRLDFNSDNYCEKTLQFSKENVSYDLDFPYTDHKGILLFQYSQKSTKVEFLFVQLETNRIVKFMYDTDEALLEVADNFIQ